MDESEDQVISIDTEHADMVPSEKKSIDLMNYEERQIKIAELKERWAQLKRKALPGKCPILFPEINREKIDWENVILREPYESWRDALKSLTATTDGEIAAEIFTKGLDALPGVNIARHANIAVQALADASPQSATEARLCLQETALYAQGMQYLRRAENCDMLTQKEFYLKSAIKLLRLHNETIEAHSKYRRGGEQRVVVQHVSINNGGQAVVNGSFEGGGGRK